MMSDKVLFEELATTTGHRIGVVTLMAKDSLNALDQGMTTRLLEHLTAWQKQDDIVCVFLQGDGNRAFCAGGDIRTLRDASLSGDQKAVERYFEHEYRLDYLVHTYSKPVVCWGHGFVMGGGVGLMAGADFRVVTDTTMMAMPEINIGLYPDVGASWLLNRMPGFTGLFVALTGCHLNAADAMYLGLGNRFIDHAFRQNVLDALCEGDWHQPADRITFDVIHEYSEKSAGWLPYSKMREHRDRIQSIMGKPSLAECLTALERLDTTDDWLNAARETAGKASPLSLTLAHEQLKRSRHDSLKQAFQTEWCLSVNTVMSGDFCEGVRALLVDKDQAPVWQFQSLDALSADTISHFFTAPSKPNPLADL